MDIYLVGGAVRDELLGLPIKERDWVVVGATPEWMLSQGFKPVGKDFPVFLHPKTKEEYALARTERKSGYGYKGFICYAAPEVTLEEDLQRRDLTINAMAKSHKGEIIDPFQGQQDLKHKKLRHVSPAFIEDPLRVLRVARFSAYLGDFKIAQETLQLMQAISQSGELLTLSSERIWKELERAIQAPYPVRFFEVLQAAYALPVLFPEIQSFKALKSIAGMTRDPLMRLVVLLSSLTADQVNALCKRVSIPTTYQTLALLVLNNYLYYQKGLNQSSEAILAFFKNTDALRRPDRFEQFLHACQLRATPLFEEKAKLFKEILQVVLTVKLEDRLLKTLSGKDIGERLTLARKQAIEDFRCAYEKWDNVG